MRPITPNQLRAVQATMTKVAPDREDRLELLSEMFGRAIESTRDLSWGEAALILSKFGGHQLAEVNSKKRQLRSTIYHLSMRISWLNRDYPDNGNADEKAMNKAKVDQWLLSRGVVKKPVMEMSVEELGKVVGQMKAIVKNQTIINPN